MSTDDPRNHRDDETADWPVTPPPAPSEDDGEATTMLGGDGEATQWAGTTPPPSRPQRYPVPPPQQPSYGGPPPRPWTSGPPGPTPPQTGPGYGAAPGWAPQPGYPPRHGFPTQTGYPPPSAGEPRHSGKRTWYLVGGAAVVVIAVVAAVLITRDDGDTAAGPATATTAAPPSTSATPSATTTTTTTRAPVSIDPARLPQMLLPADAISTALSAPGMVPGDVQASADVATDSIIEPPNCTSAWAPGKTWTYQLSGFLGMARQLIAEQPAPNHAVVQAVLAFPDASAAKKSYDDQLKSWGDCQSRTITSHVSGSTDQTAVVGTATDVDGLATLQVTQENGPPGVACERALTVAGNVVVDVRSCSPNVGDTAAAIARDIAAKVNAGR